MTTNNKLVPTVIHDSRRKAKYWNDLAKAFESCGFNRQVLYYFAGINEAECYLKTIMSKKNKALLAACQSVGNNGVLLHIGSDPEVNVGGDGKIWFPHAAPFHNELRAKAVERLTAIDESCAPLS